MIPAGNFTLSIMYVPVGQATLRTPTRSRSASSCSRVISTCFVEDETGKRITTRLGPWSVHLVPGRRDPRLLRTIWLEPVYFQVMLGRGKPEAMGYADEELYKRREAHLKAV